MSWSLRKITSPKPFPCEVIAEPAIFTKKNFKEGLLKEGVPEFFIKQHLKEINDKRLVLNLTHDKGGLILMGSSFLILACIGFFANEPDPRMVTFKYVFAIICLLLSLANFIYLKCRPERLLIFDRERQLVTLPFRVWGKNETLPICEVYATETHTINLPSSPNSHYHLTLIRTDNVPVLYQCYDQEHVKKLWSLFVWYMDKTRPLPPGELFDPYREQDEKRRLAEQG